MRTLTTAVPLALAISMLSSVEAMAQALPSDDAGRTDARALAEQGDSAFAAGRCDLAIPFWKRADAAFHAPTLMLRVARCQSLLGHVVDASAMLRDILSEPLAPDAPEAFAAARESATQELPAMLERIAWLSVSVDGPPSAAATVEVDGLVSRVGAASSLDPGEHHVFVRVLGATYEKAVSLTDGERREVRVSGSLVQPPPTIPTQRKVGYAIGALGATAMLVGGAFGLLALSSAGGLSGACGSDRQHCPPADQPKIDALKSRALTADLTFGSGLALLGGGAVIAFTSPASRSAPPIVRLTASVGGLAVTGVF
jgi:hypothetical protein